MRIAIDVMGGDNAPDAILDGALDALDLLAPEDQLVLVGDKAVIEDVIAERGLRNDSRIVIDPTTQVIEMGDPPVTAIRNKPDSSIVRIAKLGGRRGVSGDAEHCQIVISAGNTGAMVAAAQMSMRRLRGVHRPGIAIVMPTFHGPVVLCDVGANPEPRATHLHQYGLMAAGYAEKMIGIKNPRVALLSIGSEEAKGNTLVKEASATMKKDPNLNYVGFAEGRDLFDGKADVVICEGFTGNVVLKLAEGLASGLFKTIAAEIFEHDPELAARFEPVVKSIYKKHDYHEYGGAPLLGANGICIICHGSSEARSIYAAIRTSIRFAQENVNQGIVDILSKYETVDEGAD